jgi:hypothetical protein
VHLEWRFSHLNGQGRGPALLTALGSVKILLHWQHSFTLTPGDSFDGMRSLGSTRLSVLLPALLPSLVVACAAGAPGASGEPHLSSSDPVLTSSTSTASTSTSSTHEPVANVGCSGDELQYDPHAFAASLAVAMANELHRWDAVSDLELRSGKLALSATGEGHCQAGCSNIRAILSLQEDASSVVPGHDPAAFRGKLASWYLEQQSALRALLDRQLVLEKGVFRLKNRQSGKYMQVDTGSLADNAPVNQRTTASQPGSNEWRVVLDHTAHRLVNVRSDKCLALSEDSVAQNVTLVQQTCSGSALQRFGFAKSFEHYALLSKTGQALHLRDSSTAEDAPLVQALADISQTGQHWALEPVSDSALSPNTVADGVYTIVAKQSGKSITVDAYAGEDAAVEQDTFRTGDDRFLWYVARVEGDKFSFTNRRTGKCVDLESTSTAGRLVQRSCSDATTQLFTLNIAGDGTHVLYSLPGNAVEVAGTSTTDEARLGADTSWTDQRRFVLTPVLGGEPHQLSFSHATADGPCGDYYWYDMQQPSGQPLRAPEHAFVQLMFAGGRHTAGGSDENPFLEQQPGQVALDPSGYLNGARETAGSCVQSDILYDPTGAAAGACCSKQDGSAGTLEKASFSATLYLCR